MFWGLLFCQDSEGKVCEQRSYSQLRDFKYELPTPSFLRKQLEDVLQRTENRISSMTLKNECERTNGAKN